MTTPLRNLLQSHLPKRYLLERALSLQRPLSTSPAAARATTEVLSQRNRHHTDSIYRTDSPQLVRAETVSILRFDFVFGLCDSTRLVEGRLCKNFVNRLDSVI